MEDRRRGQAGFVYVLTNRSLEGMVKIGLTTHETEGRARKLSQHTGIPTEFEIAWDELVGDCSTVERRLHERFADHRVNERREFFRIPLRTAIAALQEEAKLFRVDRSNEERIDVLPALEARFRRWLRPDLVGAYIGHIESLVYFEAHFQPRVDVSDLKVERIDLDDIYDDTDADEPVLSPSRPIVENSRRFVEWDTYTLSYFLPIFSGETEDYFNCLDHNKEKFPFRP